MKIYILLDEDEIAACYTTKTQVDTHMKINPHLSLREAELDGPLPEHENVTRYEVWIVADFDKPIFETTYHTIVPGGQRRGWIRKEAYCFWSYESQADALVVMGEFRKKGDFDSELTKLQVALYGRLM